MERTEAKARIKELTEELAVIDNARKPLEEERSSLWQRLAETTERRCNALAAGCVLGAAFQPEELVFSAYRRCACGAGLAYPVDIGPRGFWDCAAILMGEGDSQKKHSDRYPFAFYDIKSEGQPSAHGATTRPTPQADVQP